MKYKATNIKYCIEPEDVEDEAKEFFGIDEDEEIEDRGIFRNDFDNKCDEIIEETLEQLPSEMVVEIDDDVDDDDVDDALCDVISERTGWMVDSFKFEKVEENIALHGTLICSRPYVIGDSISLGSFTFLFENGQEATFDFCEYSYKRDAKNDSILYFKGRELDEDSFPDSKEILLKGLRESKVKAVTDVYINDDIEFDICLKELTIYIDDTAYPIAKEAMRNAGFSA